MTVGAISQLYTEYVADGLATPRSIGFPLRALSDLIVEANGVRQTLGTHYAVTGASPDQRIVPLSPFWPSGAIISYWRETRREQQYDVLAGVDLRSASLEGELDRTQLQQQEQDEEIARALKTPKGEEAPVIGSLAGKPAGTVLEYDGDGTLVPKAAFETASALAAAASAVQAGDKADRSEAAANRSAAARDIALATADFPTLAAAQAAFPGTLAEGETFSYLDGDDLMRRGKIVGGVATALPGPYIAADKIGMADGRLLTAKLAEIAVSITDYGALANVDDGFAAAVNNTALANAFAASRVVRVPGASNLTYSFAPGASIPDDCALIGDGALLKMRGEGITLGNRAKLLGVGVVGINPAVAVGTKGSGVPGRTSPTPDSPQYSLVTLNTKTGCYVHLTYLANGLLNGMQANNGSGHTIIIDKAENFGNDGVFSPTEGAIVYAPALTDSTIIVRDGAQTYGLGAVMGGNWARNNFDLYIHDTRRAALHSAAGAVTGPGNKVYIKAERLGGLAPTIGSPPANHNQTGCGVFWPGAARAEFVKIINPVIIDFSENAFEGTMEIVNPTVRITTSGGVHWDAGYVPPNPGVFYGNQKIYGGTVENCRGWILHMGGEEGVGVFDIVYDGTSINNSRPAIINGVLTAPKYVHIQPVGSGNVADNITVRDIIGYDSAGVVTQGFYVQGTGGASFSNRCQVIGNRSTTGNNEIAANIRQFGNSWNTLNNKSAPHYMGIDSDVAGGGFTRSYWGYGIQYDPAIGSWRLDDLGADRTLIAHGNNQISLFVIPSAVAAGALTNSALQQYYVGGWNRAGFILKYVTTATRPTSGVAPGMMLFDETTNSPIIRNAANTAWGTVTVNY